jgi:hypothetical protein
MAYEKQKWVNGVSIANETRMSHIEDGIELVEKEIPSKLSELDNDTKYITNEVNDLVNYELKSNTGTNIALSIDDSTYVMTLQLKNSDGTVLNEQTVDLPLETMVVDATYDSSTKEIVLTLQNGTKTRFSVSDLVSGLVSTDELNEALPKNTSDLVNDSGFITNNDIPSIPTKTSDLTNDSGFATKDYVSTSISTAIGSALGGSY